MRARTCSNYELAMMAWFSGCLARPVHDADGILRWEQIRSARFARSARIARPPA